MHKIAASLPRPSKKASSALLALTQAALALPGIAHAAEIQTDYLFSEYREQDLPAAEAASGQKQERYEIQSHLFRLVAPVDDQQTLGLNLTYESMSGASPWFVTPGPDGKPMQVMSGASIREDRIDGQGTWSLPIAGLRTALTAGYSDEDDYRAVNGGVEVESANADASLTWSGGLGYSSDTLEPTVGPSSPNVIRKADKDSLTVYGGAAMVLDAATVVQAGLSYTHHDGFLSDPYKLAWIESLTNTVADHRPGTRQAWTFTTKLRHHLERFNAALHADYRYFRDDWEVNAHTVEVSWHQILPNAWRVSPSLRYYSQSRAFFYAPYYAAERGDGYASSDYRLSPFGAISGRLDVTKALGDWALGGGVEYYKADGDFALKSVNVESPGLVEYLSIQLRLAYKF